MNALIEKRQEIAAKLSKLLTEREESIKAKVNAYCAQLEAEPMSEDIVNAQKCIKALDDVIAYESMVSNKGTAEVETEVKAEAETKVETEVEPVKPLEEAKLETKPEVETIIVDSHGCSFNASEGEEARPGMAYIGVPERR